MEKEERIEIRNKFYNSMLSQGVLVRRKNDVIFSKRKLPSFSEIELFDFYCSQFESQKEAVYCIVHNSDFTEHVCPICGKKAAFSMGHNFYRETCGSRKCINALFNSPEFRRNPGKQWRKDTGWKTHPRVLS